VKLPALPRGASVAKPSGTAPKPPAVAKLWRGKPVFAITGYAAVACRHFIGPKPPAKADPPRASTRGMLAKASQKGIRPTVRERGHANMSLAPPASDRLPSDMASSSFLTDFLYVSLYTQASLSFSAIHFVVLGRLGHSVPDHLEI